MTISAEPRLTAPASRRVPDFFIVGHHKSGTTALYHMLRLHPQIYMPDIKEPRYFASDLRALLAPAPGTVPDTLEEYMALFATAGAGQKVGEASPSYLRSREAAAAIAAVQPDARIIAIFREPASFLRSLHLHLLQEHVETEKDFRRAVAGEEITRAGQRVRRYSDHVDYVEQLRRFHAVFPREQVLVLIYDDFRADNAATVRRVLRFLEVDDTHPIDVRDVNPTVGVRHVRLDRAMRGVAAGRGPVSAALRTTLKTVTSRRLRGSIIYPLRRKLVYGEPPPPDEQFMQALRRTFKPQVVGLSEYLNRDLVSLWGYDKLD
jgi:Sulfotransferase family